VLAAAQLKFRAALPPALADQVGEVQARFHLDAATWYRAADEVPFLSAVADAVWRGRALSVRYRRWKEPTDVDRRLEPYGLVLKAGRWYLVAGPSSPRTYRVDQILNLTGLADEFIIPASFNLASYWQRYKAEFLDFAVRQFLALGPDIEVLDPPELRSRLAAMAHATSALYRSP
jgi:predicted DNA-binding transcriptional regulator YafY